MASGEDNLCPFQQQVAIQLGSPSAGNNDSKISEVWRYNRLKLLDARATEIGINKQGIQKNDLLHFRAAMAMYLEKCPYYTISIIGRWVSDTFLHCVHKQVEQFSHNKFTRRLHFQYHCHICVREPKISHMDPCQCNLWGNAKQE